MSDAKDFAVLQGGSLKILFSLDVLWSGSQMLRLCFCFACLLHIYTFESVHPTMHFSSSITHTNKIFGLTDC